MLQYSENRRSLAERWSKFPVSHQTGCVVIAIATIEQKAQSDRAPLTFLNRQLSTAIGIDLPGAACDGSHTDRSARQQNSGETTTKSTHYGSLGQRYSWTARRHPFYTKAGNVVHVGPSHNPTMSNAPGLRDSAHWRSIVLPPWRRPSRQCLLTYRSFCIAAVLSHPRSAPKLDSSLGKRLIRRLA